MKIINIQSLRFAPIFVAMLLALAACDKEQTLFTGPYHVRFDNTTATVAENSTAPIEVKMHYVGPKPTSPIEIQVSVEGGTAGTDFDLDGSTSLTIPAGEYYASFNVTPIDNLQSTGAKEVTFTITSVSGDIPAGQQGLVGKTFKLTIQDDDCPLVLADFFGTFSCNEPGYGDYNVSITEGAIANRIVIANFWDYGSSIKINVDFDPNSNVVTVPDQPTGLTSGGIAVHVVGSGEYSSCEGSFFYDYTVYRISDNAVFDNNRHTYTRP